jgi:GNAT superfamily N-acetyltransferase
MFEFRWEKLSSPDDPLLVMISELFSTEWSGLSPDHLYQKYSSNPASLAGTDDFLCVFDDGKLIAANGYIPATYSAADQVIRGVQDCDSFVLREYRRQGIFSKVVEAAVKHYSELGYDFIFGFPNGKSFSSYCRAGWRLERSIEYCVNPIDPKKLAKRIPCLVSLSPLLGILGVWSQIKKSSAKKRIVRWKNQGFTFESSVCQGIQIPLCSVGQEMRLNMKDGFSSWRFSEEKGNYIFMQASSDMKGKAWAVFARNPEKASFDLCTFDFTSKHAFRVLLDGLVADNQYNVEYIRACSSSSRSRRKALTAVGFWGKPLTRIFKTPKTAFMYHILSENYDAFRFNWEIEFVDYDTI